MINSRLDEALSTFPIRNIVSVCNGLTAKRLDFINHFLGGTRRRPHASGATTQVINHNLGPLAGKLQSVFTPNSAPGAGHDHHAIFAKLFHSQSCLLGH